ncbi:hypothetical protein Athai_61960 [Actinocatenispora thailandica]|uniref:DUF418 domain-containing protein n=1 Tax=Actinocatenispora thailandica TaxID=227318 RepID=A0A7R7I143_9ACTN|nr:DUF418 domain-containing protein [Actinocatenispora thailandica]BCJ38693.1 hypothetical protein Athai_61960 [Actinocatenispora thailandica]
MPLESRSVPAPPATTRPPSTGPAGRISALDVLRGFAVCGILVVNVQPIANAGARVLHGDTGAAAWPGLLFDQRFFPIFSLLFGIGFTLLLRSAARRVARPRVVLLRRLLVLLALGLAHHLLLWQGDILAVYAVGGLAVLLPVSFGPRWLAAALAVPALAAGLVVGTGFFSLIPGLFLTGAALTRYGVVDRLDRARLAPRLLLLGFAVATAPVLFVQLVGGGPRAFALAGLLTAGGYCCGLVALLGTPLAPALRVAFTPLGRMALTNYLTATVLVRLTAPVLGGRPENWSSTTVLAIAGGILAAQWVFGTLWLRRYRQGPLEWLWRWATWARRPPLRRAPGTDGGGSPGAGGRGQCAAS